MAFGTARLFAEPLRSIASGSIGASYTIIGDPFTAPIRIVYIQNLTDALLVFSFYNDIDHFVVPAESFVLFDVTSNRANENAFYIAQGNAIYVKQLGVPTTGSVYVTAICGESL